MNTPAERRQNQRRMQTGLITLESLEIGMDENSRMINSSESGLHFKTDQFLQPGSDIFIRVKDFPHDQTDSYKCHHAKVIWGKRLDNGSFTYSYGVEYIIPSKQPSAQNQDPGQSTDLRKYPRIKCGKPAIVRLGKRSCQGTISDISRNGCFIESEEPLNIRQIFDLIIPDTKFSRKKILLVEVVRLSPVGVGVKYKRILKKNVTP